MHFFFWNLFFDLIQKNRYKLDEINNSEFQWDREFDGERGTRTADLLWTDDIVMCTELRDNRK